MKASGTVLIIPDLHAPYGHPDAIDFLKAVANLIKPYDVINLGDEVDGHSISFHEKDPGLLSPSDELRTAIERLKPLYQLFPKMQILESNHGSLVYRRGRHAGLPRSVFKSYREILEAPKGWVWHNDLVLTLKSGERVYFTHGKSFQGIQLSKNMAMHVVQGHYHTQFQIQHWSNPHARFWSMQCGCLIDDSSLAFAYNKATLQRPILGCGAIIDNEPRLFPMILDKFGRWRGKL